MDDWPNDILRNAVNWLTILRDRSAVPFIPYSDSDAMAAYGLHCARRARLWHKDGGGFELRRRQGVTR